MLKAQDLKGVLPAITTHVHADDTIDLEATAALFTWLKGQGVDGVIPLGGTGEYGALSRPVRNRYVELCAAHAEGQMPVIPGVLDTGYYDALAAGKDFAAAGADGLLVINPYYTNPTQQGIRDYYLRYADESPLPILIYEIPYRTRIAIDPQVLIELSGHENIIGMKACNTDMYHFLRVVAGVADSFSVLSGEDTLFPLHMAAGAKGGILVTANLLPNTWQRIYQHAVAGEVKEAVALHRRLIPMMNLAFSETNPGPMKSVMELIGVNAPKMLAPLREPGSELKQALLEEYRTLLAGTERQAPSAA